MRGLGPLARMGGMEVLHPVKVITLDTANLSGGHSSDFNNPSIVVSPNNTSGKGNQSHGFAFYILGISTLYGV